MKQPNPGELSRISGADPDSAKSPRATFVALAVVLAVTITFVVQNRNRTAIHFLVFDLHARTWAMIAVAIVLGALVDRVFLMWRRKRRLAKQQGADASGSGTTTFGAR
jgi:uncharacterized integral membrane protein